MVQLLFAYPLINADSFIAKIEAISSFKGTIPGIDRWQLWIQNGPSNAQFCIHYLECQDSTTCSMQLLQKHLSNDYSLLSPHCRVEKVLDLVIDSTPSEGYELVYLLPLLPNKVIEHREYCRLAMNERREATVAACKTFGMIHMKKWIQQSPSGDYVLYYQKMNKPLDEVRTAFLSLKDDPKALHTTKSLREQTGLSFEELSPRVTCINVIEKVFKNPIPAKIQ